MPWRDSDVRQGMKDRYAREKEIDFMLVRDIETVAVRDDIAAALQKSIADVPVAEKLHKDTEHTLASAVSEVHRLMRVQGSLSASAAHQLQLMRDARRKSFDLLLDEKSTIEKSNWAEYAASKFNYERIGEALSYCVLWRLSAAEEAVIVAEIAEREAYCDYIDSMIARQRLAAIHSFQESQKFDPGISLTFSSENADRTEQSSWSERTLREIRRVRSLDLPNLRSKLLKHKEQVRQARQDSPNSI
jgi:hypothetical protein